MDDTLFQFEEDVKKKPTLLVEDYQKGKKAKKINEQNPEMPNMILG